MSAASSMLKYPLSSDKALPDAPDILTPLRKHQSSPFFNRAQSPFFDRSRWNARRELTFKQPKPAPSNGRLRWIFPLPALIIALVTFAMATVLLLYLVAMRRVHDSGISEAIVVSEIGTNTLVGLTISTVSTHLVSISVPFLIYVAAYCVAGTWLSEQEFPRQSRPAQPTPLQYAHMVKMLSSPNIASIFQAARHSRQWRQTVRFPRAFHLTLMLTVLIFGLSYSLILADIWLHGASSIVQLTVTSNDRISPVRLAFNESVCTTSNACLNNNRGWASDAPWVIQTGLAIAANDSTAPFSIVNLDNASGVAAVVPSLQDPSLIYETPSFGVRAQCASLTPNCTTASHAQCPGYPLAAGFPLAIGGNTSASSAPSSSASAHSSAPSAIPAALPVTSVLAITEPAANPQSVRVQLYWSNSSGNVLVSPASPAAIQTNGGVAAWASCNLTYYNLALRHDGEGNYSDIGNDGPVLANPNFAAIMQGGLLSQAGNLQLLANLQGTMLSQPEVSTALSAMDKEMAHLTLALFAGTLQRSTEHTQASSHHPELFGKYPLAPVIVYIFLLYAYAFTAGGIYVWAARLRSRFFRTPGFRTTSAVRLAQMRLTDPLAIVAALYPSFPDGFIRRG
ncbi:hypothetical protein R3P38DRAFT_3391465 [Favolaschia claudopus]|uniref:Uncharacterized protein n=1 Tax=Favolaschia claudopus TaxID=2862362 RepID=A0AAW0CIB5_9AGAR